MIRAPIAFALAAMASSAAAQTTTNCTKNYFGQVTCRTTPDPQINWGILQQAPNPGNSFMQGFENGQRMRAAREERARQERQWRDMLEESQRRQQMVEAQDVQDGADRALKLDVARLLANRECQAAQDKALAAGNIALAKEAKDYCAPSAP